MCEIKCFGRLRIVKHEEATHELHINRSLRDQPNITVRKMRCELTWVPLQGAGCIFHFKTAQVDRRNSRTRAKTGKIIYLKSPFT